MSYFDKKINSIIDEIAEIEQQLRERENDILRDYLIFLKAHLLTIKLLVSEYES